MSARVLVPLLTKRQRIEPLPELLLSMATKAALSDVFRAAKTRALLANAVADALTDAEKRSGRRMSA